MAKQATIRYAARRLKILGIFLFPSIVQAPARTIADRPRILFGSVLHSGPATVVTARLRYAAARKSIVLTRLTRDLLCRRRSRFPFEQPIGVSVFEFARHDLRMRFAREPMADEFEGWVAAKGLAGKVAVPKCRTVPFLGIEAAVRTLRPVRQAVPVLASRGGA
jgi:hypothetical protein